MCALLADTIYMHESIPIFPLSLFFFYPSSNHRDLHSFPTRRSSDRQATRRGRPPWGGVTCVDSAQRKAWRSEEHTSELHSLRHLVCRLLLEKKKNKTCRAVIAKRIKTRSMTK